MEEPRVVGGGQEEVRGRGWDIAPSATEMTAGHDELRRQPVTSQVTGALGVVNTNGEVLMDLEMQVGGIHSVIVSDRADQLASGYLLTLAYGDPVQVRVEGVCEIQTTVLDPGMAHDDNVSPGHVDVAGQHDHAVPDRMDGLAKSFGASSIGDPVLAEMSSRPKASRFVVAIGFRRGHGQVKPVGRPRGGLG